MTLKQDKAKKNNHANHQTLSHVEQLFVDTLKHCEETRVEQLTQEALLSTQEWGAEERIHTKKQTHTQFQWCWLLLMAKKLGIEQQRATYLAAPYPYLLNQMRQQIDQMTALAKAKKADQQDQSNKAILSYLQHLASVPYDEHTRFTLGRLLICRGEIEAAQAIYKTGLNFTEGPLLMTLNAEILINQGQYQHAHRTVKAAYQYDQQDSNILITLAKSYQLQGQVKKQKEYLAKALQIDGENPIVLASYYAECPHNITMTQHLVNIRRLYQEVSHRAIHQLFVKTLLQAECYPEALKEAQILYQRHKKHQINHILLATCHLLNAQLAEAIELQNSMPETYQRLPQKHALDWLIAYHDNQETELRYSILKQLKAQFHESSYWVASYANYLDVEQKHQEAAHVYQTLLQSHQDNIEFMLGRARNLLLLEDYEATQELCHHILEHEVQCIDAFVLLVDLSIINDDFEQALIWLAECKDHERADEIHTRIHLLQGNHHQALKLLTPLIHQKPLHIDLLEYWMNAVWQSEEDPTPWLLDLYQQKIPYVANHAHVSILLGYLLSHVNHLEEAAQLCHQIFQSNSIKNFSMKRMKFACELAYKVDHQEALFAWSEVAVEHFPQESYFWFYHAQALWQEGRVDEALAVAFESLKRDHVEMEFLLQTGHWLHQAKCPLQAIDICDQLWSHEDLHTHLPVQVLCIQTYLYASHPKRLQIAYDLAEQLLTLDDNDHLYEHLIPCALEAELFELAHEWSQQAITKYPNKAILWRLNCLSQQALHQYEHALYSAFMAVAYDGNSLSDHVELSKLLEHAGRIIEAKFFYHKALNTEVVPQDILLEYACFLIRNQYEEEATSIFNGFLQLIIEEEEQQQEQEEQQSVLEDIEQKIQHSVEEVIAREKALDIAVEQALEQMISNDESAQFEDQAHLSVINDQVHTDTDSSTQQLFSEHTHEMIDAICYLWLSQAYQHWNEAQYYKAVCYLRELFPFSKLLDGFLGLAYAWQGKLTEALPLMQIGCEKDLYFVPDYTRILWNIGERGQAIDLLQKSIIKMPNESVFYQLIISYLIEEKEGEHALEMLQSFILLNPDPLKVADFKAEIYQLLKSH